jgi:hypothetical protein
VPVLAALLLCLAGVFIHAWRWDRWWKGLSEEQRYAESLRSLGVKRRP